MPAANKQNGPRAHGAPTNGRHCDSDVLVDPNRPRVRPITRGAGARGFARRKSRARSRSSIEERWPAACSVGSAMSFAKTISLVAAGMFLALAGSAMATVIR